MSTNIKQNIESYKKLLQIVNEIDIVDKKLTRKYNRNERELDLYDKILQSSNNNFYTIVNNLQECQNAK